MRLLTAPTAEPLSLAEVKDQLGINSADDYRDSVILRRISQARQWAEDYLSRALMPQVRELRFVHFPCEITLRRPPVVEIAAVQYVDTAGTLQTLASNAYELDDYPLLPVLRATYGTSWPGTRGLAGDARVQYRAGYGAVATGAAKTITGITRAAPGVVSLTGHGWQDGQLIQMDVAGMTELDGNLYRIRAKATDTFQLALPDGSGSVNTLAYTAFTSGTATPVQMAIPPILLDAMTLLVGHWTNYQARLEGEGFITRVPLAIQQMFDSHRIVTF